MIPFLFSTFGTTASCICTRPSSTRRVVTMRELSSRPLGSLCSLDRPTRQCIFGILKRRSLKKLSRAPGMSKFSNFLSMISCVQFASGTLRENQETKKLPSVFICLILELIKRLVQFSNHSQKRHSCYFSASQILSLSWNPSGRGLLACDRQKGCTLWR